MNLPERFSFLSASKRLQSWSQELTITAGVDDDLYATQAAEVNALLIVSCGGEYGAGGQIRRTEVPLRVWRVTEYRPLELD